MFVLASSSPRRKELISHLEYDFEIIPSYAEEIIDETLKTKDVAASLAKLKAEEVYSRYKDKKAIIGVDTIVVYKNEILGKPKSEEDAIEMIKKLSGKKHIVYTGVCIILKNKKELFTSKSIVKFNKLSNEEINTYISTKEYIGKAGAYGIQGKAALFVKYIKGDFYSIMGLPISKLNNKLKKYK